MPPNKARIPELHHGWQPPSRGQRPGFSETFPFPLRYLGGDEPLAYFDTGDPAAPSGEPDGAPLLLIHGLGGNFTHWEHVAGAMARHRRVLGLDLPGYGDSARPRADGGRCSMAHYAHACVRLLDALDVERAVFCGHSMGGQVVAEAALAHPARVERLVLLSANGFVRRPVWQRLGRHLIFHEPLVVSIMERLAVRLLHACFGERNHHAVRFIAQAEGRPEHPTLDEFAATTCSLAGELVERHYLDDLHRIAQPTLVIWGDRDRLIPFHDVPEWAARLPDGRLVVLDGCGHLPMIERPAEVVEALRAFLADDARASLQPTG